MKTTSCIIIVSAAAFFAVGCNPKKTAIKEDQKAAKEEIDLRKENVNAAAKEATERTDANASIDKATIEANKDSIQAQLDADKKRVDAAAEAAKAKVDAENQ